MSFICSIGLALVLPGCSADIKTIPGYVEGEYVALAPLAPGLVRNVLVDKGDLVKAGQLLVELDSDDTALQVIQARSRLLEARAALANLGKGRRPEEIEVLTAAVASLEAEERRAQQEVTRASALFDKNVNSRAQFDAAETNLEIARARLAEGRANLAVARLPARPDEVAGQEQRVADTEAGLRLALHLDDQRKLKAAGDGRVEDIIRRSGEAAGPTAPVLSILKKGSARVRFYIGEPERASIRLGTRVTLSCASCPPNMSARIERIASSPEFTPPVIYSIERRQKLSYLVEARGEGHEDLLQPGLLVTVQVSAP